MVDNQEQAERFNGNVSDMSFEDALKELENIVSQLESGNVDLSSSIQFYERGEQLRLHCEGLLKNAELRVEKLILNKDNQAVDIETVQEDDEPF